MTKKQVLFLISELLSSSSDSDGEFESVISTQLKRARIENFVDVIQQYNEAEFKRHFRVARRTFDMLVEGLQGSEFYSNRERRNYGGKANISPEIHIYLFLWFAGNKSTLREVALLFNVSESSAFQICERVMNFLKSFGKNIIKFPLTEEERASVSAQFELISGFPNVIGCIDGCYIKIRTPCHKIRSTYTNRHHQTSITLQGICDHKKRFLDAFTGVPSKMHDSRVFSQSFIKNTLEAMNGTYHLLGDAAYPISPYLLTPYRDYGNLTEKQTLFNNKLSKTRVLIENTFGLLKNRFRQLLQLEFHKVVKISKFVLSCCVLHNLCIDNSDPWDEEIIEEEEDNNIPNQQRNLLRALGEQKREELADSFFQ